MTNREALTGRSSHFTVLWALSLAALAVPVAVTAQTSVDTVPTQPSAAGEPQASGLAEVIVTARKRSENVQSVPASVSAYTGDQLQQSNIVSAADFVKIAPGVTLNASGRGADTVQFIIRGIGPADSLLTTDPAVATYVDEVYIPRDDGLKLALFDIDRTEILKGPQGTLYGRNAEGGAVGIFTRKPSLSAPSGFLSLEFGEYGTEISQGAINLPLVSDVLATRLAFSVGHTNGYTTGAGGQRTGNHTDEALRDSILFQPNDRFTLRNIVSYTHTSGQQLFYRIVEVLPGVKLGEIEMGLQLGNPFATAGTAGLTYLQNVFANQGRYSNQAAQGQGEDYTGVSESVIASYKLSDQFQIKSVTGYNQFTTTNIEDVDATPLNIVTPRNRTTGQFVSQELQLNGTLLDERLSTVAGGYFSTEWGTELAHTSVLPDLSTIIDQVYDDDVRNQSFAGYAQADYKVTNRLSLSVGLRETEDVRGVTYFDRNVFSSGTVCQIPASLLNTPGVCSARAPDLRFSRLTYGASLSYDLSDNLKAYVAGRTGYRSGGYNIYTTIPGVFPSFKPDSVADEEVGLKSELFDRRLRLNVAVFHSRYSDMQKTTLTFSPGGTSQEEITNAASATIEGAEAEMAAHITRNFDLDANFAYTDARYDSYVIRNPAGVVVEDDTGQPFQVPRWTYGLGPTYHVDLPLGQLSARLDWSWRSGVIFTQTNDLRASEQYLRQQSYGLLSGRLEWLLPDNFSIALLGRNLLNKDTLVGGVDLSALGWKVGIPGEPRYVGVQLLKKWGDG
jgi:iron complex outermembrane receptor protein